MKTESHKIGSLHLSRNFMEEHSSSSRVLLLHGMGEHSGRHANTMAFLVKNGIEVIGLDFRGQGKSDGKRMWIEAFEEYVNDVKSAHQWVSDQLLSKPFFLLGHSLGGTIAIHFVATQPHILKGLILSAPGYRVGKNISRLKILAAKFLSSITPRLVLRDAVDLSGISRDPKVVETFRADPLSCHFNTVRQGNEILRALNQLPELATYISIPTLIVHGESDALVPVEGSRNLLAALSARDKTLEIFPRAYHELHNDLCKENYFKLLLKWIANHS